MKEYTDADILASIKKHKKTDSETNYLLIMACKGLLGFNPMTDIVRGREGGDKAMDKYEVLAKDFNRVYSEYISKK